MKTEKYGKILYSGTPIILSFFFIFNYIKTKESSFIFIVGFLMAIIFTFAMYFIRYVEKIPLKSKNKFYYYLFLSIIWIYYILEKSSFSASGVYLMDTIVGFFIYASIAAFFFIGLLTLHMLETWNELTGENIWAKYGLT